MDIAKFFILSANNIVKNKDILTVYRSFVPIFFESRMLLELAGIYEKIYNLTGDNSAMENVGDIFFSALGDLDVAASAYKLAGKSEKLNRTLKQGGKVINRAYTFDLEKDKYTVLMYIVIFLFEREKYNEMKEILILARSLKKEPNIAKKVSQMLSQKNDSELVHFALELDEKNIFAHIQNMEILLEESSISKAIDYYNEKIYQFDKSVQIKSENDLYWYLSDKFGEYADYYKQVLYQSKAIENE